MIDIAIHLVLLFTACVKDRTTYTVVGEAPLAAPDRARIVVEVEGGRAVSGLRTPASSVERRERTARDQALPGLSEFGQRKARKPRETLVKCTKRCDPPSRPGSTQSLLS